jgi:hypothetical protein
MNCIQWECKVVMHMCHNLTTSIYMRSRKAVWLVDFLESRAPHDNFHWLEKSYLELICLQWFDNPSCCHASLKTYHNGRFKISSRDTWQVHDMVPESYRLLVLWIRMLSLLKDFLWSRISLSWSNYETTSSILESLLSVLTCFDFFTFVAYY